MTANYTPADVASLRVSSRPRFSVARGYAKAYHGNVELPISHVQDRLMAYARD